MPKSLFSIPWEKMISFSLRKQTALQNKKLQHMMRLFPHAPYYAAFFQAHTINSRAITSTNDLLKVPFTTKEDLVATVERPEKASAFVLNPAQKLHTLPHVNGFRLFFSSILKQELMKEFKPIHVHFTSGRSAMSVPVLYTQHDLLYLQEASRRMLLHLKIPRTVRVLNVFPYAPHLAFWQAVYATNYLGVFGIHTGGGKGMGTKKILDVLEHMRAEVIIGMPSYVYHLLSIAAEEKRDLAFLRYVILGGEAVTLAYKEKLKKLLDRCGSRLPLVYSTYAFTEGKVSWTQCHEESGYHLYPDMEFIEIVDPQGNRVPDGQTGEIVYTGLDFRGTVFLRYKTGDIGRLQVGSCPYCGAKTPRLDPAITRSSEITSLQLTKIKGSLVDLNAVHALLSSLSFVDEWQAVLQKKKQFDLDELVVHVAPHARENHTFVKNELIRQMQAHFHITPSVVFTTKQKLVESLGLETHLKEKRILDKRKE
ncbi:AMP-binding protein [Candidatus Woesearchaeota archaeon]|nr:AMP-binding protein [Candidatus Woesearchaeota archaeon]